MAIAHRQHDRACPRFANDRTHTYVTPEKGGFLQLSGTLRSAERNNAMTDITQKKEEETLTFDVSDEALEVAAGAAREQVNFTLGSCTGLSECPG